MRIRRLKMSNFRSVAEGEIFFPEHTVLIGGNSVGKSTICEALDLLLGPQRLARASPVDEHDFFERRYIDEKKNPIPIELEVVLTDMTPDVLTRYRSHLELWNTTETKLLDENASPKDCDADGVIPALRIKFEGIYDIEDDDFFANTFFASPPPDDGVRRAGVTKAAKRQFGFLYLRALRTGSRALSLELGSLLDIILNLLDEDRSEMWEQTLQSMENLDPAIDAIPQLRSILDQIDKRVRQFVNLSNEERTLRLFPSALTRESLRRSIALFGSSEKSNTPVPYWRLGSGMVNSMVFSLLTFIAKLKSNVIFAMEEPEIAIPPHTQRRIVQYLHKNMNQSIVTTHSPFILEQYQPENVVLLERETGGTVFGRNINVKDLKAKTYKGNIRRIIAEAMLGKGVLCVEGKSDAEAIYSASTVLEEHSSDDSYTPLDLSGVTVIPCEGDGELIKYGKFFARLGLKTYALFDRNNNTKVSQNIKETFHKSWELDQKRIEQFFAEEIPVEVIRKFLNEVCKWEDYPDNTILTKAPGFDPDANDEDARKLCDKVLQDRKGSGYAQRMVELCEYDDLPEKLVHALEYISEDLPNDLMIDDEEEGEDGNEIGESATFEDGDT